MGVGKKKRRERWSTDVQVERGKVPGWPGLGQAGRRGGAKGGLNRTTRKGGVKTERGSVCAE